MDFNKTQYDGVKENSNEFQIKHGPLPEYVDDLSMGISPSDLMSTNNFQKRISKNAVGH